LTAYLWSWVENQVLAAMKIVPLGQVEGQELLHRLKEDIPAACLVAQSIRITEAGSAAFGLALTSTRHETQYSRLFRS
jgi:urease accessory protein